MVPRIVHPPKITAAIAMNPRPAVMLGVKLPISPTAKYPPPSPLRSPHQ